MKSLYAAIVVASSAASAQAHVLDIVFGMRGQNVVPASDSDARATGMLAYNHHTFRYDIDLVVTGVALDDLLGTGPNSTPLHIYEGRRGQNGDITLDPSHFTDFVQDGENIRLTALGLQLGGSQGAFSTSIFDNEEWLYEGSLYIQLYTVQYPNGEIRGQLPPILKQLGEHGLEEGVSPNGPPSPIPSPATPLLMVGVGLLASRRRRCA